MPRSSTISRSGRSASSCEPRRRLEVPTRAPSASSPSEPARPTNASVGSSRPGTPTSARPSGSSPGRSLAECTPSWTSPSRIARSTPRTKRALSPTASSAVRTVTTSAPPSAAATASAWISARVLPRDPSRSPLTDRCRAGARAARSGRRRRRRPRAARCRDRGRTARAARRPGCRRRRSPASRFRRRVGSCSRREAIARAAVCRRSRSASVRPSHRSSFSARTRSTTSSARSRSAAIVGVTSCAASQRVETAQLRPQDALGLARFRLAAGDVALDQRLQVVHVVEADPGELAAGRVDVARDGEVDQQERAPVAVAHHLGERLALDHVVRRAGRGDDDVGVGRAPRAGPRSGPRGRRSARRDRSRGRSGGWR